MMDGVRAVVPSLEKEEEEEEESRKEETCMHAPQPLLPSMGMELEVGSSRNSGSALASRLRCCLLCCAIHCHQEFAGTASPSPSPPTVSPLPQNLRRGSPLADLQNVVAAIPIALTRRRRHRVATSAQTRLRCANRC